MATLLFNVGENRLKRAADLNSKPSSCKFTGWTAENPENLLVKTNISTQKRICLLQSDPFLLQTPVGGPDINHKCLVRAYLSLRSGRIQVAQIRGRQQHHPQTSRRTKKVLHLESLRFTMSWVSVRTETVSATDPRI